MRLHHATTADLIESAGRLLAECADRACELEEETHRLQSILREIAEREGIAPRSMADL